MTTLLLAMGLALGVSFMCSFIEAALLSLTPANVADLNKTDPVAGTIWQGFKSDIGRPISVILLLNTTAHTIGASVAGAKWSELFGDRSLWVFSLAFTFLMLQYTEILPKTLGVRFRVAFAKTGGRPLALAVRICSPIISLIHLINRPFEVSKKPGEESANTISEIDSLASLARVNNLIGRQQEKIISSATHLAGTTARQVMIPLDQVTVLEATATIHEAFLIAHQDLHTRYPVRDSDNPQRLAGYVNFKELVYFMSTNPNNPSFLGIIRPLNCVAPETNASELLKLFVDQHNHMVVVEEEGRSLGIVTVEDVIEELVGDIEDEFDRLPQVVHSLAGGVWIVGGGVPMAEVSHRIGEEFGSGEEILADWLAGEVGPAAKPGEYVRKGRYEFAVRRIKRGHIFDATITDRYASRVGLSAKKPS
ncbi:MAG: CNNM domain-containing protein [Planctomycetaceae bacterium]|nr:CNNM domain-containing protein [Planctomycetaceae bacterium]